MLWIDRWRVMPRIVLIAWLVGTIAIVNWYMAYEIVYERKCDSTTLSILLDRGVDLKDAESIACTTTDVIGHPTGYTALVSTIVAAGSAVFGLYVNSGGRRKEED